MTTRSSKLKRIAWKRFLRDLWAALSFNPSSRGRSIWDIIVFIAVLYNGFVVPLRACFLVYNIYWWITFDILTDLFLYVDIIVKFFTEYDINGYTVKDKRKMAIHYLRSWTFWIDVASVLSTEIYGYILNLYPWFRMNRLLKILTNDTYFNSMENVFPKFVPVELITFCLNWSTNDQTHHHHHHSQCKPCRVSVAKIRIFHRHCCPFSRLGILFRSLVARRWQHIWIVRTGSGPHSGT